MKHGIKILVGILLFSLTTMAGASVKWESLNPLKNVVTSKVDNGFIIRFEFEKPVGDYKEPVFFDKSVQIDFPSAFIKPAKKYFPADSFSTTKIFAAQFDEKTLRVRFLKKNKSIDLQDRFHVARQGRFLIVRLDENEPVSNFSTAKKIERVEPANHDLMNEDELADFLARASEKIRALDKKKVSASTELTKAAIPPVQTSKTEEVEKVPYPKVTRAGMGVEPIVEQIRKAAQQSSKPDNETGAQKQKNKHSSDKNGKSFSLKDSRPTGKPIELIPSGLKMV